MWFVLQSRVQFSRVWWQEVFFRLSWLFFRADFRKVVAHTCLYLTLPVLGMALGASVPNSRQMRSILILRDASLHVGKNFSKSNLRWIHASTPSKQCVENSAFHLNRTVKKRSIRCWWIDLVHVLYNKIGGPWKLNLLRA